MGPVSRPDPGANPIMNRLNFALADKCPLPEPLQHNMLTRGAGGRALTQSETLRKAVIIMSTYEEFMVILTVGLLIVAILNLKNKK